MATSFATSQRHRQRTRQRTTSAATSTTTATATAIVQNVLEIGLATVLERRGAFPPEFFVHQALGGGGAGDEGGGGNGDEGTATTTTMAARFDEDWLRSQGTCTSRSRRLSHDVNTQQQQQQPASQTQTQSQTQATEDSCTSGSGSSSSGSSSISSSSSSSVGSSSAKDRIRQSLSSSQTDDNDDDDDDDGSASHETETERKADRRLEERRRAVAEALLLLEWIRRGAVGGCWRRNLLSRVVVGVCVPAPTAGGAGGGKGGGEGGGPARLVESYAFDLSTAADEVARLSQQEQQGGRGSAFGSGSRKKKNRQQQQQQLHSEEDVQAAVGQMLRGIRGYIDANYGSNGGRPHPHPHPHEDAAAREASSVVTQFTNFDELDDATATAPYYSCTAGSASTASSSGGAATTTRTTLPRDRYFTFRVEFTKPISKAQLPPALNHQSEEFGTVPALGRVLAGKDAVPNKSKSKSTEESDGGASDEDPAVQREPTVDPKSLQRLGRWALGRVQPANGVSVGFHAFCEDPDDVGCLMMEGDDSGTCTCSGGRDILGDDDEDVISTAELGLRENADPQKIFAPLSGKSADIKPTEPSQESSQSAPSIAIGQSVLAYPHKGKNDKAEAVEQALSCTVVDTRVHNIHGQQYKVEFDSSCGLEHLKQWMSAERIVVIASPTHSTCSGGNDERKRKEADCSSTLEAAENAISRPKKRTRIVYRYIAKPIRFKL